MIVDFHTHIFPPKIREEREDYLRRDHAFIARGGNKRARPQGASCGGITAVGSPPSGRARRPRREDGLQVSDRGWMWTWFVLTLVFFAMFTWQLGRAEGWWA